MTKNWTMNETQKAFIETLKAMGGTATLLEIEATQGKEFATGSINTLISKGLVATEDTTIKYKIVETFTFGETIYTKEKPATKTVKRYIVLGD